MLQCCAPHLQLPPSMCCYLPPHRPCTPLSKSQARHTGIKIVQQIAILMGCAVLPHLKSLVDIIKHGLTDENQKVKTITALSIAGELRVQRREPCFYTSIQTTVFLYGGSHGLLRFRAS